MFFMIIFLIIILFLLDIIAGLLHEYGHWIFAKRYSSKVKFEWYNVEADISEEHDTVRNQILFRLCAVFLPLFIVIFLLFLPSDLAIWLVSIYIFLCIKWGLTDLREIAIIWKHRNDKNFSVGFISDV